MTAKDEVLKVLPAEKSEAMSAAQLFDICKGFEAAKDISSTLSQLFAAGLISRRVSPLSGQSKYIYWNQPDTSKAEEHQKRIAVEITQPVITEASTNIVKKIDPIELLVPTFHQSEVKAEPIASTEILTNEALSVLQTQIGGDHYKKLGQYQPWEVLGKWMTPEELKGFAKGTVIAYLAREEDKGGREDIEKAAHTLQIYLDLTKQPTNVQEAS